MPSPVQTVLPGMLNIGRSYAEDRVLYAAGLTEGSDRADRADRADRMEISYRTWVESEPHGSPSYGSQPCESGVFGNAIMRLAITATVRSLGSCAGLAGPAFLGWKGRGFRSWLLSAH